MAVIHERPNRATADEAASFVNQYECFEDEIASLRGEFMAACKAVREKQKELLDDAKSQGIAKGVIKRIAKARTLELKARDLLLEIEDEDERTYAVDIRKALGDDFSTLPLGAAAIEREQEKGDGIDPVAKAAMEAWDEDKQPEAAE